MLLKPNIKLKRITDITPALLKSRSITGLILDVDNTLSTHHGQKLTEGLEAWLALMRDNGIPPRAAGHKNEQEEHRYSGRSDFYRYARRQPFRGHNNAFRPHKARKLCAL